MLIKNLKKFSFSKYSKDISDDLIVNLSMASNTKPLVSQLDLVEELKTRNFIKSNIVAFTLSKYDRRDFTTSSENFYDFNALNLPRNQKMPVPIIHAIILENFVDLIKRLDSNNKSIFIYDFGCGAGYLTFCFNEIMKKYYENMNFKIFGYDFVPECIEICKKNKLKYKENGNISFNSQSFDDFVRDKELSDIKNDQLSILNIGFAINDQDFSLLKLKFSNIIAPVWESEDEQFLISYDSLSSESKNLMKCVFSSKLQEKPKSFDERKSELELEIKELENEFRILHENNKGIPIIKLLEKHEYKEILEMISKKKKILKKLNDQSN